MSNPIARPTEKPFDRILKRTDWIWDRVTVGALVAAVLMGSAKLPHYLVVAAIAFSCVALSAALAVLIKLGQRNGLVSVALLNDKPESSLFDADEIRQPPMATTVPIARNVGQDARLGGLYADEIAKVHELKTHGATIAGRGKVTYWIADR